jgi:hypothetical protein
MIKGHHSIHIPVMGTGSTSDTAIRVAHLGLTSAVSLVDDTMLEKLRKFYSEQYGFEYTPIVQSDVDVRSKRVREYLNLANKIVGIKFEVTKSLPLTAGNEKGRYFAILPNGNPLKEKYEQFLKTDDKEEKATLEKELTDAMEPGSVDVNIMVKLDAMRFDKAGNPLPADYSDAKTALKGFAESQADANIVFSAGINQPLYTYMSSFKQFYRDENAQIKKKIIVKVSDYRSALIQGKFLAKKGLEVAEFRIESGLNCGGHSFPAGGYLLPAVMKEFKQNRDKLNETLKQLVVKYYEKMGWEYPAAAMNEKAKLSVQGGIGTAGEVQRFMNEYDVDYIGIGTPFLFVPEVASIDRETLDLLIKGGESDYYISDASPVGVQFNNIRDCGSQIWHKKRIEGGKPGSPCPKRYLISNTEFTDKPICLASETYIKNKLEEINNSDKPESEKQYLIEKVLEKECICNFLANTALLNLEIAKDSTKAPQSICPGPNGAWFNKEFTLEEMLDQFYGRADSVVSEERPHVFAKEISMYVDYFTQQAKELPKTEASLKTLKKIKATLESGMEYCSEFIDKEPYKDENLGSIATCIEEETVRLTKVYEDFLSQL